MTREFVTRFRRQRLALLGLGIVLALLAAGILAPLIAPHDPYAVNPRIKLLGPDTEFFLGTDQLGRCVLSRLLHGISTSLTTAVAATTLMLAIGVPLGILAGYAGGWTDTMIMRLADLASTFPSSLLALAVVGVFGPSLANILMVFVLLWWAPFARIARGSVIMLKEKDFVLAAVAAGSSRKSIVLRHIAPNALPPVIVLATLRIAAVITHVAAFSFIGLGAQPPVADWGVMLSDSRQYMTSHPLMLLWPGLAIMVSVFALNMLGEGLNEALLPSSDTVRAREEST
jgi:ABC-type dipeptide/oligopeptide/nickel transport systems, permease components